MGISRGWAGLGPLARAACKPHGPRAHVSGSLVPGRIELTPNFVRLLRDSEAEVRVAAAGKVAAFSKLLTPQQIVTSVIPCVRELSMDSSQYVRAALAGVVMEMAPTLGKALTIEHLVPIFLTLLKDVYPDVRLNVISKLDQVRRGGAECRSDQEGWRVCGPGRVQVQGF